MSAAKNGDTVQIHYTGTLDDGKQFDSSEGREPLEFVLGSGGVIPGFDDAVTGMNVGDKKTVRIEPDRAYGHRQDDMQQEVPKNLLPEEMPLEVGMPLQAQSPDGQTINMSVVEIRDETIIVDANHPLAGQALTFAIELVARA
ncbi:MAG: peptidylprolyl isomerase [Gammaproteobacteria bacterium]|nr:peptidylprolyl isomerase [Gammaproteobacteria bacterium]